MHHENDARYRRSRAQRPQEAAEARAEIHGAARIRSSGGGAWPDEGQETSGQGVPMGVQTHEGQSRSGRSRRHPRGDGRAPIRIQGDAALSFAIDVNILLYASDTTSARQAEAARFLEVRDPLAG